MGNLAKVVKSTAKGFPAQKSTNYLKTKVFHPKIEPLSTPNQITPNNYPQLNCKMQFEYQTRMHQITNDYNTIGKFWTTVQKYTGITMQPDCRNMVSE